MKRDLDLILSYTTKKDECMEWTRCFNTDGYPRAAFDGDSNGKVHRVVWELHNKDSAKGLVVRHSCDNPRCINPAHLSIGTNTDNMKDRTLRGRTFKVITKPIVAHVKLLLSKGLLQKEVANRVGIDPRRVSDIKRGKYNDEAQLTRYL